MVLHLHICLTYWALILLPGPSDHHDIQIYLTTSFDRPSLPDSLTACIRDIKQWMSLNFLKLNNNKTEILIIGYVTSVRRMDLSCEIDGVHVKSSSSVRNLGILFDSSLSFASHISSVVKTSFFIFVILHVFNLL